MLNYKIHMYNKDKYLNFNLHNNNHHWCDLDAWKTTETTTKSVPTCPSLPYIFPRVSFFSTSLHWSFAFGMRDTRVGGGKQWSIYRQIGMRQRRGGQGGGREVEQKEGRHGTARHGTELAVLLSKCCAYWTSLSFLPCSELPECVLCKTGHGLFFFSCLFLLRCIFKSSLRLSFFLFSLFLSFSVPLFPVCASNMWCTWTFFLFSVYV